MFHDRHCIQFWSAHRPLHLIPLSIGPSHICMRKFRLLGWLYMIPIPDTVSFLAEELGIYVSPSAYIGHGACSQWDTSAHLLRTPFWLAAPHPSPSNSYGTGTCVQDPCELSADLVLYRLTRKSNQAVPTIGCIHQIHRRLRLSRDTCMS